ncbi:hypothetical protein [Cryobacterium cryoconiti]|uniref:hypothetical protein n=1 Tax=Cryobacterium cryoconiti TaxID=1259239 RepID=UPI00141A9F71|nr:hypothetical protein [Cryobacterium cryoconiti]
MAERDSTNTPAEPVPANQVSPHRWAELKRAYVARLPKSDRAAIEAAAERSHDAQD